MIFRALTACGKPSGVICVLLGINMTLEQLAQKGQPACTDSLAARDWLLSTRKEP